MFWTRSKVEEVEEGEEEKSLGRRRRSIIKEYSVE